MKVTQETITQWLPLINYIVSKHFKWVYDSEDYDAAKKLQRAITREDLLQEGVVALTNAIGGFNKDHFTKAKFKTYAFRIIYNHLANFIYLNWSPIKTALYKHLKKIKCPDGMEKATAARSYKCFSELITTNDYRALNKLKYMADPHGTDPAEFVTNQDFKSYCLKKLQFTLSPEDYNILILRSEGRTYTEIGEKVGLSHEHVRNKVLKLFQIARLILKKEAE